MAFDLGQMMEQMMGGSLGREGKADGTMYDVVVVGYGPAGGVMVSVACDRDTYALMYLYVKL